MFSNFKFYIMLNFNFENKAAPFHFEPNPAFVQF